MIPDGFSFSAVNADIKGIGAKKEDLGLIYCEYPACVAGVFTKNLVKAAPVVIGQKIVKKGFVRAIIANSGNANACTGAKGIKDAYEIMEHTANRLGIRRDDVIPLSTGVIGVRIPVEKIIRKIDLLAAGLKQDASLFSRAIMTTDTYPKVCALNAGKAKVLGIAKGSGMIAPDMATTLAVVLTDARIDRQVLNNITKNAIKASFNAITVDGDTSTNDTLLVLTSNRVTADAKKVEQAITEVIHELAMMIVKDGEGATKVARISVKGAKKDSDAKKIAMCVANSPLVKTALFGSDPNWGRIMGAIGRSGVTINPDIISISIGSLPVVKNGTEAKEFDEKKLHDILRTDLPEEIQILITVGKGTGSFTAWTTDLSYKYIEINSSYRT
jgi:glutamate N-acetyltransferase/amino-acid N-acetyltransferase